MSKLKEMYDCLKISLQSFSACQCWNKPWPITVTGKNARFIQERIGTYDSLLNINTKQLKSKLKFCPIENADV